MIFYDCYIGFPKKIFDRSIGKFTEKMLSYNEKSKRISLDIIEKNPHNSF